MGEDREGIDTLCLYRPNDRHAEEETFSDSSLASSPLNIQWEHVPKAQPSAWKTIPLVRRLNRRYWCIALAILILVSLYWSNPYEISEVVSTIDLDKITEESPPIDNAELIETTTSEYEEHHANHAVDDAVFSSVSHDGEDPKGTEDQQVQTNKINKEEKKTKQDPKQKESHSSQQNSKGKSESHKTSQEKPATTADKGGKKDPNDHRVYHPLPQEDSEYCTTWPVDPETGMYHLPPPSQQRPRHNLTSLAPVGGWQKPEGIKIVAMVFYGRKRYVDILDCYLRANLVSAADAAGGGGGGYLDEVWFMVHTSSKGDVEWLHDLVDTVPGYRFVDLAACTTQGYGCIWEYAVGRDTIYVKIDDDILFIHPDAIPQLIHTRIAQPRPYAISAQLVNSPVTGLQALHYGAMHPFLPDPKPHPSPRFPLSSSSFPSSSSSAPENQPPSSGPESPPPPPTSPQEKEPQPQTPSWRPSTSGLYPPGTRGPSPDLRPLDLQPSYRGHHWVLLSPSSFSSSSSSSSSKHPYTYGSELLRTPLGDWASDPGGPPQNIAFGPGWTSWAAAAQQEYSLLLNIERDEMERYFYGRRIDFGGFDRGGGSTGGSSISRDEEEQEEKGDTTMLLDHHHQDQILPPKEEKEEEKKSDNLLPPPPPSSSKPQPRSSSQEEPSSSPGGEQLYDMLYQRYNLNFVAIWGSDVQLALPISDDELEITSEIPRKLGRPFVIDTRSVVAHHSFFTQSSGIMSTDLLDRYRGLANEMVCEAQGNGKVPWDWGCEGF